MSSATRDLMLIQQNKFYWISNRSGVAKLIQTVTKEICDCTGQSKTFVYAHRDINYLLFRQRLLTKTGGILDQIGIFNVYTQ